MNINYVHGLSDRERQTWMPPDVWFVALSTFTVLGFYVPTHLALRRLFPPPHVPVAAVPAGSGAAMAR